MISKVHLLAGGPPARPLTCKAAPGQQSDSPLLKPVLEGLPIRRWGPGRPRCSEPSARGQGVFSRTNRSCLHRRNSKTTITEPADQRANRRRPGRASGHPPAFSTSQYRQRNAVKRCVSKCKQSRTVATHYDKRAHIFNGALTTIVIVIVIVI
ncbi:hypothetical protein [Streptomyces sp. Ac-502]|uniref:hypothetical protein n=1 Tax=Streptomyces sp. Ac-502 TaxID=3342801 RepID=UPI00386277A2